MDGEQRGGDAGWPAARPGRQAPQSPAPGADPGATQAYPGPLAGARSADPGATQAYAGPLVGSGAPDPAATQAYGPAMGGASGRSGAAATTAAPPNGPVAATQVFGAAAGTTAGPGLGQGPGQGFDTVAFQGPAAGGYLGAGRPGYDQQTGYAQSGYDQQTGYAQTGYGQQTAYPGQPGPGGPGGYGGYGQPGGFGPGGRPSLETGPSEGYPGGPSGPGRPGGKGGSGGPSRTLVLTSLGVAALLAVGAGTFWALNRPVNTAAQTTGPTQTIDTAPPSMSSSTSSTSSPVSTSPTPSGSPTTVTPTTVTPTTSAPTVAPTGFVPDPWARGLDFGTVLSVKKQGGGAVIQVKRQQFLTGDAAKQYYAQHPDKEPLDYAIVDVWEKHQFTVTNDCLVYGQSLLGNQQQVSTVQLTVGQFVTKTKALLDKQIPLHVWLYHKNGQNGPVGYLAEQYTP